MVPQPLSRDGSCTVVSWPRTGLAIGSSRLRGAYAANWRLRAQFIATRYRLVGEPRSSGATQLERIRLCPVRLNVSKVTACAARSISWRLVNQGYFLGATAKVAGSIAAHQLRFSSHSNEHVIRYSKVK